MNQEILRTVSNAAIEKKAKEAKQCSTTLSNVVPFLLEVITLAHKIKESNLVILDVRELITARTVANEGYLSAATVGQPKTLCSYDADGFLVGAFPVDRGPQQYVAAVIRLDILDFSHYELMVGHPGERRVYDSRRLEFHWPHLASDVYAAVCDCQAAREIVKEQRDNAT